MEVLKEVVKQDGEFSEKQYAAYNSLIQSWEQLQQSILQIIPDYYTKDLNILFKVNRVRQKLDRLLSF